MEQDPNQNEEQAEQENPEKQGPQSVDSTVGDEQVGGQEEAATPQDESSQYEEEQGKAIASGLSDFSGGPKKPEEKAPEEGEGGGGGEEATAAPGPGIPDRPMQMPNVPKPAPATGARPRQRAGTQVAAPGDKAPAPNRVVTGPGGTRTRGKATGPNGTYKLSPEGEDNLIRSAAIRKPAVPASTAKQQEGKKKGKAGRKVAIGTAAAGALGLGKGMTGSAASFSILQTIIDLLT